MCAGVGTAGFRVYGPLVLRLAPWQRLAARLTDAAMPGVADSPQYRRQRSIEIYATMLRLAIHDKVLSRAEEINLAQAADRMGISAGEAARLRQTVLAG
jgi:hypothetical protein